MRLLSYAKINLYLDVVGKDRDGYHFIESLFQEVSFSDVIEVSPSEKDSIVFESLEVEGDTTIHKAIRLFRERFGVSHGYHVRVEKHIPMGAGLGGGSSNGATVLRALALLEGIPLEEVVPLGERIGSDVPFFFRGGMAWVSGKGEKVEPLESRLENVCFLIVYPGIHVSTAWAYSLIDDYTPHASRENILPKGRVSLDFLRKIVYNKFQPFVFAARKDLAVWKATLDREASTTLSFMSGSGSSLVYVYESAERREADYHRFSAIGGIQVFCADPVYHEE